MMETQMKEIQAKESEKYDYLQQRHSQRNEMIEGFHQAVNEDRD